MLGVGSVGAVPAGAAGTASAPRGSVVPQLHTAIVERLRARIELCRRHHSTCETRYRRGQAETSDREREATLQLLSIVQQGPGNRKTKGTRSGTQHALEYSRVNGEQKPRISSDAESKLSTRIALQGSLRRKIEGPSGYTPKQNGLSCMGTTPDFKRVRMETISLLPSSSAVDSGQSQSLGGPLSLSHTLQPKDPFMMPLGVGSDLFNMTLRDVKKEPADIQTCGHSLTDPAMAVFEFKDEAGGPIDPELQDLFDELTKSVPPLNDLELEKMLKQDDEFGLDLGRPSSASAAHPCPHLDKPIKTEYSPDFGQVPGSSPQLRPASAGPSFSMATTALATSPAVLGHMARGHVSQASATASRGLPAWPEISHAEQLKQMAANQQPKQPPNALIHHQQHNQAARLQNWPSAMDPNSNPFGQEIIATPSLLRQPGIGPQSSGQGKGVANCLFKPSGYNQTNSTDIKALRTRPRLNFTTKASTITSHVAGSQSKPSIQNPESRSEAICSCVVLQFASISWTVPCTSCTLQSSYQSYSNQDVNSNPAVMHYQSYSNQDVNSNPSYSNPDEKFNTQDQFNRHLTRPPPDYKHPQGAVGVQHSNLYPGTNSLQLKCIFTEHFKLSHTIMCTGLTSSPVMSNGSDQSHIQALSCHMHNGQRVKVVPNSGDRRFHVRSDPHSSPLEVQTCASKLHQQPNSQVQIAIHQNKPQFQGSNTQVVTFQSGIVSTTQHSRTSASQDTPLGQGLDGITTPMSRETSWGTAPEKSRTLPVLDVKRHQSTATPQSDQTNGHFGQRPPFGPPNQVAPLSGQIPLNSASRSSVPRASHVRIHTLPGIGSLNQSSPEQQGPGTFQNSQAGRLTFDFLQDGDNTLPGINADSDFIDSLLKSTSGNDDWMKDINLEEILGGQS
uniref:Neurogenic mastermind-like N-terminal domain-containing protein n=1 Tax=Electrophorus electricus TaxID=8005 RepID=A0AAY5EZQ8_ELEEL